MGEKTQEGASESKRRWTRYPVISLSAEYLVMALLMRRNILTYKAPPNNEGYDLICIHPDPRRSGRQIRVQVKSRLATDCDRGFPVKSQTLDAFDYLAVVFLNVGYFMGKAKNHSCLEGAREPEIFIFPASFIKENHIASSSWEKVRTRGLDLSPFEGLDGIEKIAEELQVEYPKKH